MARLHTRDWALTQGSDCPLNHRLAKAGKGLVSLEKLSLTPEAWPPPGRHTSRAAVSRETHRGRREPQGLFHRCSGGPAACPARQKRCVRVFGRAEKNLRLSASSSVKWKNLPGRLFPLLRTQRRSLLRAWLW